MSNRWNSDPSVSGGGVLIDNGLTRSMSSAIPRTDRRGARGGRKAHSDAGSGGHVQLFVRAESGARGTIDLSWSLDKERDSYIEIYGSNGTVRVGWKESKFRQATSPDWVVFGSGYDKIGAMRAQVGEPLSGAAWPGTAADYRRGRDCFGGSCRTGLSFAGRFTVVRSVMTRCRHPPG